MARRVFQLAKELGVKSTAVVAKCQAEGIDIKNHMSTLSAGLEATIREWFTSGENATTVETAAPVDLEKVKSKKRARKKAAEQAAADAAAEAGDVATQVAETEVPVGEDVVEAAPDEEIEESEEEVLQERAAAADQDDTLTTTAAVSPDLSAGSAPEVHRDEKAARPKRLSPKELQEKGEETEEEIAAAPAAEQTEPGTVTEERAAAEAAPGAEGEVGEEAAAEEDAQRSGPHIVSRTVPQQKPEAPPEPPKPREFVPAPAVLQGPKVIRTESPESIIRPPKREPRKQVLSSKLEIPSGKGAPPTEDTTGTKRRRKGKPAVVEDEEKLQQKKKVSRSQRRKGSSRRYESIDPYETTGRGDRDILERQMRLAQASGSKLHRKERQLAQGGYSGSSSGVIERQKIEKAVVKEPITVKEMSAAIGIRANDIIAKLMRMGIMANINQALDSDSAMAVALEYGVELEVEEKKLRWDNLVSEREEMAEDKLKKRPPIVAFLGHVDHGKTSLLDRIREANVTAGEAGGITQHIGSYLYDDGDRQVAFLDTPGHKAFTEMRARGATMTDVLVLVVAADDGVMPQTEEAINHAKAAGVPIIVALNKMDLPNADENKVLGQLAEKELLPTEWGGETEVVRTSATTGQGIDDLLEYLDYVAELNNLQAVEEGPATGWVVEAEMTSHQGVVANLLVKNGTLRVGDIVVSRSSYGRIRTMADSMRQPIEEAGPSTPVEITGLDEIPAAGDRFYVVESISQAAQIAEEQKTQQREKKLAQRRQITLDNLFTEIAAGDVKELNVIVKADVQGSVDVLCNTIQEMNTREVAVKILHAAVGGITESDVLLAQASNAIIIGFQVVADEHARNLAEREGVEIRLYRVIYQISDDIKKALEGMLEPHIQEKPLGRVEVRQLFRISRIGVIAGCIVQDGVINRSARMRVIRDNVVIRDNNPIQSLRRGKDDVAEVRSGYECGIKLEGYDDIKEGDRLEAYELVEVNRTLDSVK